MSKLSRRGRPELKTKSSWIIHHIDLLEQSNHCYFWIKWSNSYWHMGLLLTKELRNPPLSYIIQCTGVNIYCLQTLPTFSDHLITTIVDVPPYGNWLLIIAPSSSKSSICIDSCLSYSKKKPWTDWLPLWDNHSSKYWSICPWSWNSPYIRYGIFNYLKTDILIITLQSNFLVDNRNFTNVSLILSWMKRWQEYHIT